MAEGTGLSASDVALMTRDNDTFGDSFAWIVMLLIVAGIFNGNVFGGGSNAVTEEYIANQFTNRDIFDTNQNVSNTAAATQMEILNAKYDNAMATMENRYANQLGVQQIISNQDSCCCTNRTEALKNTYELAQLADRNNFNTLLGNKDLTAAIAADGDKTRALITAQYEAGLLEQINDLKAQVSNQEQTQTILNTMGRWHGYPSCSNCGCGSCSNLI